MADLSPELAEYQNQFNANRQQALEICAGLSSAQLNLRPGPDAWSVAECLSHLNISARLYVDQIMPAIERARQRGLMGQGPYKYGIMARWLTRTMEPPPRRKYKVPRRFTDPSSTHDIDRVLTDFDAAGEDWNRCLEAANGLHLARVKVRSPASPLMRFPLGSLFAMMAAHERRHLWQAKQAASAANST
jgi:hypothetical protein